MSETRKSPAPIRGYAGGVGRGRRSLPGSDFANPFACECTVLAVDGEEKGARRTEIGVAGARQLLDFEAVPELIADLRRERWKVVE